MEYDEKIGYGSNYEKHILRNIFLDLLGKHKIGSVLEFPANKLMGKHQDMFENTGVKAGKNKADLVWNFCEFEQSQNPEFLLKEMAELSHKYIFIITGNRRNLGVILHRIFHLLTLKKWDHGQILKMDYKKVKKEVKKNKNLKILEKGAFDIPWFILDVYECGRFLRKFVPKTQSEKITIKPSCFENLPFFLKKYLAHHFYLLVEKI